MASVVALTIKRIDDSEDHVHATKDGHWNVIVKTELFTVEGLGRVCVPVLIEELVLHRANKLTLQQEDILNPELMNCHERTCNQP